ncbi:hypothetical protein ES703_13306 [subsurface metagenome]
MKTQEKKQKRIQRTGKKVEDDSLSYMVEVRDKEGRVLQRISAPSRSYVQQWNQLINYQCSKIAKTVKDTGGIDRNTDSDAIIFQSNAGIGVVTFGIRIGKGTTAVAITDYALESPCGEGTGADEFNHQLVEFTAPSVIGPTCSFTITRTMIDNSGAAIADIKEIGCYCKFSDGSERYALAFRDVLPSALSIPDGGSITVTYTIAVTV